MKMSFLTAAAVAGMLACTLTTSHAGELVPIPPVPGSTSTHVSDINNANVVVGSYTTDDGKQHGFYGTLDGQYTTFDYTTGGTIARYIDDEDDITGQGLDPDFIVGKPFFRTPDGKFKEVRKDGTPLDGIAAGIGKRGNFVGEYDVYDDQGNFWFYGYRGTKGKYKSDYQIQCVNSSDYLRPRDMSMNGTVVGYCGDAGLTYHAFILKKGVVTLVDYPGAHLTEFLGINRKGAIGGAWCDIGCGTEEAFMFDPVTSAFNVIDIPGAAWSGAGGLNDAGIVTVNSDLGSYIYCPKKKTCPIQSPNAVEVPDRIIHAKVETRICEHDCVYQAHIPSGRPTLSAAVERAVASDPELRREAGMPFRK